MSDDSFLSSLESLEDLQSPPSHSFNTPQESPQLLPNSDEEEKIEEDKKNKVNGKRRRGRQPKQVESEDEEKQEEMQEEKQEEKQEQTVLTSYKNLRPRKPMNYFRAEYDSELESDNVSDYMDRTTKKRKKSKSTGHRTQGQRQNKSSILDEEDIYVDENDQRAEAIEEALDKIPKNKKQLQKLYENVKDRLLFYRSKFIQEQKELECIGISKKSFVAEDAIPINADVTTFDWKKLADAQMKFGKRLFDVIMMDPPWQLSSSQPSRGVAIAYSSLADEFIQKIPVQKLQTDGFIFIWTINAKYALAVKMMEKWGYKLVDEITWIKKTVNGKIAKGHGFYLQHAKESCLVGVKGNVEGMIHKNIGSDVIFSERRGQSQKPEEIYQLIESLVPNGKKLSCKKIFGRRNNIRSKWITIGNEL